MRYTTQHCHQHCSGNPDENAPVDLPHHQHQRQENSEASHLDFAIRKVPQTDKRGGVRNHQLGIPQPDERNKHADPSSR